MKFEDFQYLQGKAKWSFSFGEGYDNYSAGAQFKSGIGFGVYNSTFFPPSISASNLPINFFNSYEEMSNDIVERITMLDNEDYYEDRVAKFSEIVFEHNSPELVKCNLKNYYIQVLHLDI